jgi:acyl-coenzyme A synthetase/AMP-(fatty) acid ligase
LGFSKGDRVVEFLPANPELVYAQFLNIQFGKIHLPLNHSLAGQELGEILHY